MGKLLKVNYFKFLSKIIMYWINLWRELMVWQEVKKVANQNLDLLKENNLKHINNHTNGLCIIKYQLLAWFRTMSFFSKNLK